MAYSDDVESKQKSCIHGGLSNKPATAVSQAFMLLQLAATLFCAWKVETSNATVK